MADSLLLKGFKEVKNHKGSELKLQLPKRGNFSTVKKWWAVNAGQVQLVPCAVFKVTAAGQSLLLAIETSAYSSVRIDHDGAFNFTFSNFKGVSRGALFTLDNQLIEHYVFPKISRGRTMTVIPVNAAQRPSVVVEIGTVTVSGSMTVDAGARSTFKALVSGNATDLVYSWSLTGEGEFVGPTDQESVIAKVNSGSAGITCVVSTDNEIVKDSPISGFRVVTVKPEPDVEVEEEEDS
jgi:hypothetical protein